MPVTEDPDPTYARLRTLQGQFLSCLRDEPWRVQTMAELATYTGGNPLAAQLASMIAIVHSWYAIGEHPAAVRWRELNGW